VGPGRAAAARAAEADREVAPVAEVVAEEPSADKDDYPRSRYSGRFHFLLGALLACGAAAVALLFAALLGGSTNTKTITLKSLPAWSRWKPDPGSSSAAAQQIATHVAKQYHLPNGRQLVLATGGGLNYGGFPATIVLDTGAAMSPLDGVGVQYRLCGIDPKVREPDTAKSCTVPAGGDSRARRLLLQREALELALYSFHYLPVTQTVVLMPPTLATTRTAGRTTTRPTQTALLFRSDAPGLGTANIKPLKMTLAEAAPTLKTVGRAPDAKAVTALTRRAQFEFQYSVSAADGQAFLFLAQPKG
jgi:hypothetical protein